MRSYLFVPANSERKCAKGLKSGADALILDLEDSVALNDKADARKILKDYLAMHEAAPERPRFFIRINDLESPFWQDDLEAILAHPIDGLVLPKPRSGKDVIRLHAQIGQIQNEHNQVERIIPVLAIVTETAQSLLNLASYVDDDAPLMGMTWGAEDLATELGAQNNRDQNGHYCSPYIVARASCLYAAAAAGVFAIDTVFTDFRDMDGLRQECEDAARDGFIGKMAIHPAQVPVINQAFTPSEKDIADAQEIIAAFAEQGDAGVISINGKMLDRPHLSKAEKTLARAGSLISGA